MPLITCPECGHDKVSSHADKCVQCGFPVEKIVRKEPASNESTVASDRDLAKKDDPGREERNRLLASYGTFGEGGQGHPIFNLRGESKYKNAGLLLIHDEQIEALEWLTENCSEWIQDLQFLGGESRFRESTFFQLQRFSKLKCLALKFADCDRFKNDWIYPITKLDTLDILLLPGHLEKVSLDGLLKLSTMQHLKILGLPQCLGNYDSDVAKEAKRILRTQMPNTQVGTS